MRYGNRLSASRSRRWLRPLLPAAAVALLAGFVVIGFDGQRPTPAASAESTGATAGATAGAADGGTAASAAPFPSSHPTRSSPAPRLTVDSAVGLSSGRLSSCTGSPIASTPATLGIELAVRSDNRWIVRVTNTSTTPYRIGGKIIAAAAVDPAGRILSSSLDPEYNYTRAKVVKGSPLIAEVRPSVSDCHDRSVPPDNLPAGTYRFVVLVEQTSGPPLASNLITARIAADGTVTAED